jgi:hypothetical protein
MKTIRGRHKEGAVVVKIFIKPVPGISLSNIVKALQGMFREFMFTSFFLIYVIYFILFIF